MYAHPRVTMKLYYGSSFLCNNINKRKSEKGIDAIYPNIILVIWHYSDYNIMYSTFIMQGVCIK